MLRTLCVATLLGGAAWLGACEGCKSTGPLGPNPQVEAVAAAPTARLFLLSDVAGALEPCGCVKDQLGGMDRALSFIGAGSHEIPSGTLAAGPLFFMDAEIAADRRGQEQEKARTLAEGLSRAKLLAFTPSENERALGDGELDILSKTARAVRLDAERRTLLTKLGALSVGVIGLEAGAEAPEQLVREAYDQLAKQGAQAVIALVSLGRGPAKRIADSVPELTAIVVGQPRGGGEANTETPPGERVGEVLIAETGNHLQTVAVLDLHLRGDGKVFADASNLDDKKSRRQLDTRIKELRTKIALGKGDVAAQRTELEGALAERSALDDGKAPDSGSYFRYRTVEMSERVAASSEGTELLRAYYKKVNAANQLAFADRKPKQPAPGEASYVGVDVCAECHQPAKKFWEQTAHARAYATLADQFKEFNLDCVSCHVTGYDRPGGSTVTFVKGLTDVQCEVCHGPGSLHAREPNKRPIPIARPGADACLACHHPPHVHAFDAPSKLQEILGPGHGRPL